MPDIPPPRPNPGFTPHQPGESSPGLQDLSSQAEAAASALSHIAELEAQFLAALKQAQQANPGNLGHLAPGFPGQALAAPRPLTSTLPPPSPMPPVPPVPRTPAPALLPPAPPTPAAPRLPYSATVSPLPTPTPPASMLALQRALESTSANLESAARMPLARRPLPPAATAFQQSLQQELAVPAPLPIPPSAPEAPRLPYSATVSHLPTPALPASALAFQQALQKAQAQPTATVPPVPTPAPDPLQDYLAGLDPERQRLAQEAHERAKYAVAPPPNPEMLRRQQEHVNLSRQPMVVLGHGLLVPQTPAPAEGSVTPPPPVEPVTSPPGLAAERQRLAQEARAARLQATTRQVPPAPPNPVIPPVAMPQADLSGLAARMLQTAPQATPALPGGLVARMMSLAPPPQQTGLPAAIPLPPSAGASPLAARVGGQLQELQRRMRQAENENLTRQAQESMQRAEEEEREQQAQVRYRAQHADYQRLETPLARAAYEAPLRGEMREETGRYQQQQRAGAIEARLMGRPESLALSQAQVEAQAQAQTNQIRQQAQVAQAQAAYGRTPEGQSQIRMQQQARTDTLQAQELRHRAESVAQYGRLGTALREAHDRVSQFGFGIREVGQFLGGFSRLGAAASPQAAATLRGSMTLAQARIGSAFLPVTDMQSFLLQRGSEAFQRVRESGPVGGYATAGAAGAVQGGMMGLGLAHSLVGAGIVSGASGVGIPLAIGGAVLGGLVGLVSEAFKDKRPDIARSYEGLPQGGYTTGEGFYERLQTAGINMSPLETEVLREQLGNTVGLLRQIERNTGGMPDMVPAWR